MFLSLGLRHHGIVEALTFCKPEECILYSTISESIDNQFVNIIEIWK